MTEILDQAPSPVWNWRPADEAGVEADRARRAAAARRQGMIGGAAGLAVAAALAWLLHRPGLAAVVAAVSLLVALLALAAPLTLYRRLRGGMEQLGRWVGTAVTWLLMTLLFYLLFLPVGLAMRAAGKLGFVRFAAPAGASYWAATDGREKTLDSYRKQF
jgi:hypothetical protein